MAKRRKPQGTNVTINQSEGSQKRPSLFNRIPRSALIFAGAALVAPFALRRLGLMDRVSGVTRELVERTGLDRLSVGSGSDLSSNTNSSATTH